MPPAPSVVVSGYEELLEVAEAILFSHSVALPPTVLDKYRMLQREVKDRIHSASVLADSSTDIGSTAPSLRSPLQAGESERNVILAEKLAQSKKKTAELRAQVASLESQLHQMTLRVQQLHAMHANSAKELVAQTKHACESANQRVLAELETKLAHEAGVARKHAADALESERAFHASIVRKIEAMEVMFPAEYAGLRASQESMAEHVAHGGNPLLAAMSPGRSSNDRGSDGSNPISMTRLHLNSFFESTRAALNHSKHYRRDLSELLVEVKDLRARVKIEEEARWAMEKAARNVVARVDELQQEIVARAAATSGSEPAPPRSAVVRQRDEIVAGVVEIERRIKEQQRQQSQRLSLPAESTIASASSSAAPSFRASTAELNAALAPRNPSESDEFEAAGSQRERTH